jgi:hypothetical protein
MQWMSTLAQSGVRDACFARLMRLDPSIGPKWGRMTAHQMICHLNDSFAVGAGTRRASPATGFLQRTAVKWIALRTPLPWPHGVPTRPEIEQGIGGTPPSEWESDCSELRRRITDFAVLETFGTHPIFGNMSQADWLVWGFRHVDHHLRQFGV